MGTGSLFCDHDADFISGIGQDLVEWVGVGNGEIGPDGKPVYKSEVLQRDKSKSYDPVYGEVDMDQAPAFRGFYRVPMVVEWEEAEGHLSVTAEDVGVEREYDAIAWINRNGWVEHVLGDAITDKGFMEPREGDLLVLYRDEDGERWFDIQKVERHGYVVSSNRYTGWKVTLNKRDSLDPSRRPKQQNA